MEAMIRKAKQLVHCGATVCRRRTVWCHGVAVFTCVLYKTNSDVTVGEAYVLIACIYCTPPDKGRGYEVLSVNK